LGWASRTIHLLYSPPSCCLPRISLHPAWSAGGRRSGWGRTTALVPKTFLLRTLLHQASRATRVASETAVELLRVYTHTAALRSRALRGGSHSEPRLLAGDKRRAWARVRRRRIKALAYFGGAILQVWFGDGGGALTRGQALPAACLAAPASLPCQPLA